MDIIDQLPILPVLIPLLSAVLCVLFNRAWLAAAIAVVATTINFAMVVGLLWRIDQQGVQSYALGGWPPPWGIEVRVDLFGAYVLVLLALMALLVSTYSIRSIRHEIPTVRRALFYGLFLLLYTGLVGITVTGDAFNLFVFLEIASLSSYALISLGRDRRALNAAFQYLIMGSIGATFVLIGIGFVYMMTGTLNMQDLAQRLPAVTETRTVRAGFAFLTVGIALKLAVFPVHQWLPNAYTYAPSVVSAFLAATATKVALYALLRFMLSVFGIDFSLRQMPTAELLLILGSVAAIVCSAIAVFQTNIKRILAYSSIAQIGYMVIGLGLASLMGVTATVLHLVNHALIKGALFLAVGGILYRMGTVDVQSLNGLCRVMPWTAAAIAIGGMSLVGIPITVGFVSKWYLLMAALEQDYWWVAVVILLGSILALIYVWRILEAMYFGQREPSLSLPAKSSQSLREMQDSIEFTEAPLSLLIPTWLLVIANIYFGVETGLTVDLAERAVLILLGGQQ